MDVLKLNKILEKENELRQEKFDFLNSLEEFEVFGFEEEDIEGTEDVNEYIVLYKKQNGKIYYIRKPYCIKEDAIKELKQEDLKNFEIMELHKFNAEDIFKLLIVQLDRQMCNN